MGPTALRHVWRPSPPEMEREGMFKKTLRKNGTRIGTRAIAFVFSAFPSLRMGWIKV